MEGLFFILSFQNKGYFTVSINKGNENRFQPGRNATAKCTEKGVNASEILRPAEARVPQQANPFSEVYYSV